jgi:hypothetical protein
VGRIVPRMRLEHLLRKPAPVPPCQGDGTSMIAIPSAWGEQARLAPSRKMSLTNLCSRLNVRGIRKPPSSRAWSLRPADPRDLNQASDPARLYRTRQDPSTSTQVSRCRHHLPRVASRFGVELTSCDPNASTSRDAWSPRHNSYGRCQPLHELRQQDH